MADIDIKCAKCGTVVTVSQFVDRKVLKCHTCGESLAPAQSPVPPEQRNTARLLKVQSLVERDHAIKKTDDSGGKEWSFLTNTAKMRQEIPEAPKRATSVIVAWILFVVLAALTGWLRYGRVLSPKNLETLATLAPVIVIAFHVIVTLMAFKHSVFHGTLSLLVPGYSLYFILLVSDDFIIRSIVAGLLVGTGEDAWVFFRQFSTEIYNSTTNWIRMGGGSTR